MAPATSNRTQLEKDLKDARKRADEVSKTMDASGKLEAKLFKVVDKLEMSGKNETQKFYEARENWSAASQSNHTKYVALQNILGRCRVLEAQIASMPVQKVNAFIKKAAKTNKMIARLMEQGKIS